MKKGVTLMALAITVVVMAIIAGTIITSTKYGTEEAKITAFTNDLKEIQKAVELEMLENDYSFIKGETNKEEIKKSLTADRATEFEAATINENNTGVFYIIDTSKLDIKNNKYGKKGVLPEALVISKDTSNIYYAKGRKIKGKYYFSVSNKEKEEEENIANVDLEK